MNKYEKIKKTIAESLDAIKKEYGVKRIGIFGPFAKNEYTPKSDLDVLVEFYRTPDLFTCIRLSERLKKLLKIKVDLVSRGALKPQLKDRILNETHYFIYEEKKELSAIYGRYCWSAA